MARESRTQKDIVGRVMHEFKEGELESHGEKVRDPKQAIAIGLSEAGATDRKPPSRNRRALSRTTSRQRKGKTAAGDRE